ncbi:MAG: tetratricopeptide repeat protein [Ignavibacteriales bacterium]|nr:tetratricopeptide repeat protein [Ignavibacteriales bacterium]
MNKYLKIFFLFLFIIALPIFSQNKYKIFKSQAVLLMTAGRFSEAIDQLNKYIAANPREADGYHKRGLCYEQRPEYQYSVLDLRRAVRLDPKNSEIKKDLNRVIGIWHKQLYQKIDGHTRDIAIDPNYAFSYLEIGKSYRWLEEWRNAEIWYDEYLKRDDNASPDEIIRYTEILAKTGSIIKGERILKKYTIRYPDDWRIWSRYGYFILWLGKYKIAEDAFKTSLDFKPFFKEAEDGLDLAKREGYLTTQNVPRAFERIEYPIDKFYRLLEKDPENDPIRFDLINELIAKNRYEEAYQQLQYLQPKHTEEDQFKQLWKNVTEYRDSTFNKNVEQYTTALKENPSDKEAVMKLAESYANLFYYDSAIEVLGEYLQDIPEDQDLDARYKYAQYSAWNYEWEKAIVQIDKLLQLDPNNLDYQLLRGQIGVWTAQDLDLAEKYLLNVHDVRSREMSPLISLTSLYAWKKNFSEAKKYLDIARQISPNSPEVESAQSNYEIHLAAYEGQKVFEIRNKAERLSEAGKCEEALAKYDDYRSKRTALTRDEMFQYAAIASCAKEYSLAIEYYNKILNEQFDYTAALHRAKNYYLNQDTTKALEELENICKLILEDDEARIILADTYVVTNQLDKSEAIYRDLKSKMQNDAKQQEIIIPRMVYLGKYFVKEKRYEKAEEIFDEMDKEITNPDVRKNLNTNRLFLGDSYVIAGRYGDAKSVYKDLLNQVQDTSEVRIVKERINWLPQSGLSNGLSSIRDFIFLFLPTKIELSPFSTYYIDNQNFKLFNSGMKLDGNFIGFLSLGASWSMTILGNSTINSNFTQLKGIASIFLQKNLILSGSYGALNIFGEPNRRIGDISLRYEQENDFSFVLSFENNDARTILYSQNLINVRLNANYYRFSGLYTYNHIYRVSGFYNYFSLGDNNEGNDIQLKLGKKFFSNGFFGYEYYFSDFAFISPSYFSPQNFDSHSIWVELNWGFKNLKLKAGGKIGYVPKADYIINEVFGEAIYNPVLRLTITARIGIGNSFRYDSSYKNITASAFAFWGIF